MAKKQLKQRYTLDLRTPLPELIQEYKQTKARDLDDKESLLREHLIERLEFEPNAFQDPKLANDISDVLQSNDKTSYADRKESAKGI